MINTIVSVDDYPEVMKHKWYISALKKNNNYIYNYARTIVDGKSIFLSHFILGKPDNGLVVDHINHNPLDNRRENLQFATFSQNAQNKKKVNKNITSKYIGVCKSNNKWYSNSSCVYLGTFESELDAAIQYDKYILIKYGKNASTNGLVEFEDTINLTLDDILPKKDRQLPKNIYFINNKYYAKIQYNKKYFTSKYYETIEKAEEVLNKLKIDIKKMKEKKEEEHKNKEITRDNEGNAIIHIGDDFTIVDDDYWPEISKIKLSFTSDGYIKGRFNSKLTYLHRYLMNAQEGETVDHDNNIRYDNRLENLRLSTPRQNGYNKVKQQGTTSIYKGVNKRINNTYQSRIRKDGIQIHLGTYKEEKKAALAYNLKAEEICEGFDNPNIIDIDEETKEKWTTEILAKWNK